MEFIIEVPDRLVESVGPQFIIDSFEEKKNEFIVLLEKQSDYGSKNISSCPVGPINGIIVRLFDKISRLTNLTKSGNKARNEALVDTTLDIANYGTIGSMLLKGTWPE